MMAATLSLSQESATVKIEQDRGGAITWLSRGGGKNLINRHDLGRLIQQSYYAGKKRDRRDEGQSIAWSPWQWNPIQGGSFAGKPSEVEEFGKTDDTLHSRTVPKLWDMPDETAAAIMEQWTSFEPGSPHVLRVRNKLVCERSADDIWGGATGQHQELPAIYLVRSMRHARVYLGGGEWEDFEMPELSPSGWGRVKPPHRAMAFFDDQGRGLAIYSPRGDQAWNCGVVGSSKTEDPAAADTVHVAPLATVALGPDSVFEFNYWIILGDEETIARSLDELIAKYPQGD